MLDGQTDIATDKGKTIFPILFPHNNEMIIRGLDKDELKIVLGDL